MCQFFKKYGYPDFKHRAQGIDRETALQKSQNEKNKQNSIPAPSPNFYIIWQSKVSSSQTSKFSATITKLKTDFLKHYFFSFTRDKNIGNFLVRSEFKSDNQPGIEPSNVHAKRRITFPFIAYMVKISKPNQSAKINDHFTCICVKVIYCITCTLCKMI